MFKEFSRVLSEHINTALELQDFDKHICTNIQIGKFVLQLLHPSDIIDNQTELYAFPNKTPHIDDEFAPSIALFLSFNMRRQKVLLEKFRAYKDFLDFKELKDYGIRLYAKDFDSDIQAIVSTCKEILMLLFSEDELDGMRIVTFDVIDNSVILSKHLFKEWEQLPISFLDGTITKRVYETLNYQLKQNLENQEPSSTNSFIVTELCVNMNENFLLQIGPIETTTKKEIFLSLSLAGLCERDVLDILSTKSNLGDFKIVKGNLNDGNLIYFGTQYQLASIVCTYIAEKLFNIEDSQRITITTSDFGHNGTIICSETIKPIQIQDKTELPAPKVLQTKKGSDYNMEEKKKKEKSKPTKGIFLNSKRIIGGAIVFALSIVLVISLLMQESNSTQSEGTMYIRYQPFIYTPGDDFGAIQQSLLFEYQNETDSYKRKEIKRILEENAKKYEEYVKKLDNERIDLFEE